MVTSSYFLPYRARRALENRTCQDDDKIEMLEQMVKEATEGANEAEKKYDEVCFKCAWSSTNQAILLGFFRNHILEYGFIFMNSKFCYSQFGTHQMVFALHTCAQEGWNLCSCEQSCHENKHTKIEIKIVEFTTPRRMD